MRVLVTGATGYVGARLIPRLLEKGVGVRATARSLAKMQSRYWADRVELVPSDALNPASLLNALKGCDVAYYLIHSMNQEKFDSADREAAHNFVEAAKACGVQRIIYLGGLGDERERLSKHLRSRREVGRIFEESGIPTVILQAAMIIGAGSASFEILRYLVDRLPVMVTPRWVQSRVQPIAIANVLTYLIGTLDHPEMEGAYDIGGPQCTTYEELMHTYAEEAHLPRRRLWRLRVLTPWLSSHWIGLITPLSPKIGKPLAEGLANDVTCEDKRILSLIPQALITPREAIRRALDRLHTNRVETSWIDAGTLPPAEWVDEEEPKWAGGTVFQEESRVTIEKPPEQVWKRLLEIGGKRGWYSPRSLWAIRGFIDKLCGGVGLGRGRKSADQLHVGDAVDFWRVHALEPNRRLQLVAEMKMPGQAVLEFRLDKEQQDTRFTVTASFLPSGLLGIVYWYALFPFHFWIFKSMLNRFKKKVRG